MEGVGRWRVHVDGGREEVGARRGAVKGWPGCMGEGIEVRSLLLAGRKRETT